MRSPVLLAALAAFQLTAGCGTSRASLPSGAFLRPGDRAIAPRPGGKAPAVTIRAAAAARGVAAALTVEGGAVVPGKPSTWRFAFRDENTGAPITAFDREHEKPMHLIAVSADLATFAHVHPDLDPATGVFTLRANAATSDPDNQDAARIVPKPGAYMLFSEVAPTGRKAVASAFDLRAEGAAAPAPITPDPVGADGTITKYFLADGRPGKPGAPYRVSLRAVHGEHHPGMPMITFTYRLEELAGGAYVGIDHLQPWLGMPGHAVLIGAAGPTAAARTFRHLHAGHGDHDRRDPGAGPELDFMVMGWDVPDPGRYKIWGQFKYRGRILTFPFTLDL